MRPTSLGLTSHGGDDGIRTHDPLLAGQVLSQLSYTPIINAFTSLLGFAFSLLKISNFQLFIFHFPFSISELRSLGRPKWTRTTLITYLSLCSRKAAYALLRVRFFYLFLLVGPSGLEPPTSCLSGTRSNLLSYEPMWLVWLLFSHLVSFDLKESRLLCSPQSMSALNYLPIQSPVKYFRHCRA